MTAAGRPVSEDHSRGQSRTSQSTCAARAQHHALWPAPDTTLQDHTLHAKPPKDPKRTKEKNKEKTKGEKERERKKERKRARDP
eukprot:3576359-Rhodomonas_salina.2